MKIKVVLSGAGVLYPLHAGAIKRLVDEGHIITDICGISGGAIIAAAIASGIQIKDLEALILDTVPSENKLLDWSLLAPWKWGLYKGDKLEKVFQDLFVSKFKDTKISLSIGATNLNAKSHTIFSTENTPEFSVAKAVRASIAIPGVFQPVKIGESYLCDGGVSANFPLNIYGTGENVFGLRIRSGEQLKERIKISSLKDYGAAVISSMMEAISKEHIEDAVFARTMILTSETSSLNLYSSSEIMESLFQEGYQQAGKWLEK